MTKSNITLSATAAHLVLAFLNADDRSNKAAVSMNDTMHADGVTSAHLKSPGKAPIDAAHEAIFGGMKVTVTARLPKAQRELVLASDQEVKAMTKAQKAKRRAGHQQIGSMVGRIKRSLAAYETKLEAKENPNKAKVTTDQTYCLERIAAMVKRLEKSEGACFDIPGAMKKLGELNSLIAGK
jgi:uncharacterized FlaG/YvyC family protein